MKRKANCIPLVALALLLAACASAAPLVQLDPPAIAGCEFTIDVVVNDELVDFTGYDLQIDFDEALVSVLSVEEGDLPASYPGETFFYWTDSGTVSNSILINGAVLGGSISGPGVLASITFRGNLNGTTPLSFLSAVFRDLDNQPIAVTSQGGTATVDDEVTVSVVPDASNWIIDQTFTLWLDVGSGVTSVNAFTVDLEYDPAIIEFQSGAEGTLLDPLSGVSFSATGGAGGVTVEATITGGDTVDGPGTIALLTFEGIGIGDTDIDIVTADLSRSIAPPIGACLSDGVVTIEAGVPVEELHWGMLKSLYR